jgi:hypothetical protein
VVGSVVENSKRYTLPDINPIPVKIHKEYMKHCILRSIHSLFLFGVKKNCLSSAPVYVSKNNSSVGDGCRRASRHVTITQSFI